MGAPVIDQDPTALGAVQTEQKDSPFRKELTFKCMMAETG